MTKILVVDDESSNRVTLERILSREGWGVSHAEDGRSALEQVRQGGIDLVLSDLKMPGMSGLELLRAIRAVAPTVEVALMTAYGTIETAVEAMKEGAYDYLTKPLKRHDIVRTVRKALEKRSLILENLSLREQLEGDSEVIGSSPAMRALLEELGQVAPSDASVLLVGESGTGKGLMTRLIHRRSMRARGRLITVNCAAIPESLLESELFGHEPGAFTGAGQRREGRFDLAQRGTLFLDEVTEMAPAIQVKLLRVLQDGEYERVGGMETLHADCRVIAATNRDIEKEVVEGRFREDLYYRLNVIQIRIPSLHERPEDIPLLASHFLTQFAEKNRKGIHTLSRGALEVMNGYRWPGNVRELENAIERAVVLCRREQIGIDDLPASVRQGRGGQQFLSFPVGTPLKDVERRMLEETLQHCDGDKALTASLLGITARTIYRREAEWARDETCLRAPETQATR